MYFKRIQLLYKVVRAFPDDFVILEGFTLDNKNVLYKQHKEYREVNIEDSTNGSFGLESTWETTPTKAIEVHKKLIHKRYMEQLGKLKELK